MRTFLCILLVALLAGCITPKAHENPKSTQELRVVLQDFHMKMRWGLWEQAVQYATDNYRNEFLGRYEELGEDFKITELSIKTVTLGDPITVVEVEQEWYVEPDMTVQKKRYVESWVNVSGVWRINERIPKEEFRDRMQGAEDHNAETPADEMSTETPSSDPAP